ncbi:uncharacterized protein BO80DRAFT_91841 [Aspergillus ibericus CBS 121593]|uniref:Uncharacterized protein n=1 Tax=Aspergillus ibericus CBS 121593 TaxID=1448316 RepID=A0A395GZ10_9EURO|nr:hypothetical protein BO80DRAFT_91841 [Aspergillus ibericus CBS 121593]RAL00563.1 hypothetical protein BO80DRAFT_91841 [Aspergillus ibericus CBS 121593]
MPSGHSVASCISAFLSPSGSHQTLRRPSLYCLAWPGFATPDEVRTRNKQPWPGKATHPICPLAGQRFANGKISGQGSSRRIKKSTRGTACAVGRGKTSTAELTSR